MLRLDGKKLGTIALSVVGALIGFIVTYQFTYFFSLSGILALSLGAASAVFLYALVPSFFLARLEPHTLHPEARPYNVRKSDALASVRSELTKTYFIGRSWTYRECDDSTVQELLFVLKFPEMDASDKGMTTTDVELQLTVQALTVQSACVIQLDYQLSDPRPSITANEICKATTAHIQSTLLRLQEMSR